ncbi:MAG: DUF1064 domain-containing protein [Minisyncoccia bacterium]
MFYSNKYKAKKTIIDGITFDSKSEAKRYQELKLLERGGQIKNLSLQPKFLLQEGFVNIHTGGKERAIEYVGDFMYSEGSETIVEDCKGFKTSDYKIKRKLFINKYQDKYKHIET